jgi:ubiquinone/menaquinone biosynthesis C-methylase UbiE
MTTGPNADKRFVSYYAEQSVSELTRQRFDNVRRVLLRERAGLGLPISALDVVDVGCGAGAQAMAWAQHGHRARGIDVSAPLVELAGKRAAEASLAAEFYLGSATKLPFADGSSDVVLVSELLEHLSDWEACVNESLRVLRPGGVIYFSTTNRLCPKQQEFALPLYSWYPASLKKRCEKLAVTTRPQWVQYTTFPAVHWFSFYQLRDYLAAMGFTAKDRFDIMDARNSAVRGAVIGAISRSSALRFLGHVMTPYTVVVGIKRP